MTNHAVQPARAASTGAGWFAASGYQLGYGVFDGLTARLASGSGFLWLSSFCVSAVRGHPDSGIFDAGDRAEVVIYAGQGELAGRYFRLANMGQLSPADIASFLANLDRVGSGYIPPPDSSMPDGRCTENCRDSG